MSAVLPGAAMTGRSNVQSLASPAPIVPMVEIKLPTAAERLAASRVRLRAALMEIAHPPPRPSLFDGLHLGSLSGLAGPLIDKFKGVPGAMFVVETIEGWWAQHPLRTAGIVAGEASREFVLPVARSNPFALILGSVVLGALFVVSRPWRWLLRPALFVGLVPQLASQALKRMPIETWLGMFESFKAKGRSRSSAAKTATRSPTDDPSTP